MSAGHLALKRRDSAAIQLPVMHLSGVVLLATAKLMQSEEESESCVHLGEEILLKAKAEGKAG